MEMLGLLCTPLADNDFLMRAMLAFQHTNYRECTFRDNAENRARSNFFLHHFADDHIAGIMY
ncbi:hypothetical protein AEAE_0991 [Aeriscardovia aeriphila]|uniref:Uncharacterized protein n=1 Tax=Aeriscardovia aeriphila TaxID=218139 RepID=A0A261FBZ7_9BIFI|nr:hypothetical protein AEAE_0991 [Aeriscardovia aeriphila]